MDFLSLYCYVSPFISYFVNLLACKTSGVLGAYVASWILGTGVASGILDTGVASGVSTTILASYRAGVFCRRCEPGVLIIWWPFAEQGSSARIVDWDVEPRGRGAVGDCGPALRNIR